MSTHASFSIIPPPRLPAGFWCRLIIPEPSTLTLPRAGATARTRPRFPLSRPAIRTTWSFFRIFVRFVALNSLYLRRRFTTCATSNNLRRQRNNLHVILVAQLARNRAEDARADGRPVFLNQHGGVLIEPNIGAVATPHFFARPHDDPILHSPLLDTAVESGLFDGHLDPIAETGNPPR